MMNQETYHFDQVLEPYFSVQQLEKIHQTSIGIAGAGGLGSNCALLLTRCGFLDFVIADFDRVELSNLNRQAYTRFHIGKSKVESLEDLMKGINPGVRVKTAMIRLDEKNVHEWFDGCDVVIEAFDKPESKAMITREFVSSDKLIVSVSGLGGFGNSDRIITRKVRGNFYVIGDGESGVDRDIKPYAPCVAIAAAKQADAVLAWVLGR